MDPSIPADVEAPKDPGALKTHSSVTDNEILGHRNVFVGVHGVPEGPNSGKSNHHSRSARPHHRHRGRHLKSSANDNRPVTPPAQRVQFILGEDHDGEGHEPHPLFSEMGELLCDEFGEMEWKETARWIKFEEDVEEGGNRWSKPHVATLSLHSLFELRSMLLNGTICLDMAATTLDDICELTLDNMINSNVLTYDKKAFVKDAILKKHRHQYESSHKVSASTANMSKLPLIRSLAEIGRNHSSSKSTSQMHGTDSSNDMHRTVSEMFHSESNGKDHAAKMNAHFMKKIPKGAEASNILVGELNVLDKPLSAFIRLNEAVTLGDLTEVPVPTRFIFLLLGPAGEDKINVLRYHEIGRAVATIMSDEVFHDVAYKARKREHLLAGIDEFLDAVTVLPPGEWDPSIRIEPPQSVPSQEGRKHPKAKSEVVDEAGEERKVREDSGLVRTGRLFGGLMDDIKRKAPFYLSDFKDGIALQCVASFFFIYFACLTPIITFGGLLGDATQNSIAAIESLVSGLLVGVVYGMFSGQPLTILGSTGPILVFETILFDFCKGFGWDYLSFRLCIGVWIGLILIILVALDASAFVCYITRFTEENFACLIAFIFIKKALEKVAHIGDYYPIHESECYCKPNNATLYEEYGKSDEFTSLYNASEHLKKYPCEFESFDGFLLTGYESVGCHYVPNAFLMSVLLFIGTFLISYHLKGFKTQNFFPTMVRSYISDFAVVIAILSMTLVDFLMQVDTPKLSVPSKLQPTWSGRGWIIHPLGNNPWYTPIVAILPALLATILIFMDQQITAVIVNRKEHKLYKGCGYHLDLLIVAVLITICSIFGLPWFVAATVLSINHVRSLTRESECSAPGEKPQFLGIREQRVTHVLIFLCIGLSVFMTPALRLIPMPVLYGVFLYMGVASLNGIQFFDRILLFFMPKKYQPDLPYLRRVSLGRVHLFTFIQLSSLAGLWVIKDIKQTSILFPFMLVVMMGVRKMLDFVFTPNELKILDDILPEFKRKEELDKDDEEKHHEELEAKKDLKNRRASLRYTSSGIEVPLANGNVVKIPVVDTIPDINISEEVNKSGVWKSVESNSNTDLVAHEFANSTKKNKKRMSILTEEQDDNEDVGITITVDKPNKSEGTTSERQRLVSSNSESAV